MKLYLTCMQCNPINAYSFETEYNENGYYEFECPLGHKNFVVLQEEKFETLFQIGANAIYDGYYREAVSSFTASLERFYEFCVQIICLKYNVDIEQIEKGRKFYKNSSERQFGSFIFLYLIAFKEIPIDTKENEYWRTFRNKVIHNGNIPTKDKAIQYGEYVKHFILTIILKLQNNFSDELMLTIANNMKNKCSKNTNQYPITTMYSGNIISLVNGDINASLERSLYDDIESMKKLEAGMRIHSRIIK